MEMCIHCGRETTWVVDPAPDLCVHCAVSGLWSELWGPDQHAEYQRMLVALVRKETPVKTHIPWRIADDPEVATPVLMAIDVSGSMWNVADDVRGGFNQYVASLAKDNLNRYKVSLYLFNSAVEALVVAADPADVPPLTEANYQPSHSTALFDAIGELVAGYRAQPGERPLVVIHTDGQENSSSEWKLKALKALIEAKRQAGWGFVFLGAGIDVWQGEDLGMFSRQTVNTRAGTQGVYTGLAMGTVAYAAGASAQSVTETAAETSVAFDEKDRNGK